MEPADALLSGGVAVLVVITTVAVGVFGTALSCNSVKNDHASTPAAAAVKYGYPTFAAWCATKPWYLRWCC